MYKGMLIIAEKDGLKTWYKVVRIKQDGTATTTPWRYKSIESAQDYITQHGF